MVRGPSGGAPCPTRSCSGRLVLAASLPARYPWERETSGGGGPGTGKRNSCWIAAHAPNQRTAAAGGGVAFSELRDDLRHPSTACQALGALGYVGGVLKRKSNFQLVPWEPGQSGKGLLVLGGDPSIHTFCYPPYHQQAADALGLRLDGSVLSFVISPFGEVRLYVDRDVNGQSAEQVIAGLDLRLRPGEPDDFDDIWDEGPNEDGRSDLVGDGL